MPTTLENRVAFRSALVAVITVAVALGSLVSTAQFIAISGRVERSHEIIQRLKDLKILVKDAESGQRGYLLTGGREEYLRPYVESGAACNRIFADLARLTARASGERRRLVGELKSLISQKFEELNETIRLQRKGDVGAALRLVQTDQGERLMTRIERVVAEADRDERGRIDANARDALFVRNMKVALNVVSAMFSLAILGAVSLVVGHEMKQRKRTEEELAHARDAERAASRAKGDFLANVSHEIRTPMNAIQGMTELTLDTDLGREQRENLQVIKSAADSLLAIINDLLDFSKMEAGKLALALDDFALRDHLGDILGLLGLRAVDQGLELACRVDFGVPDHLVGDVNRLRQVLMNLVGNAIKFTERGEVVVEVESEPRPGGAVELHFRVTDTGIGISPEKREMIFAPFTQADGSTTRLYGGTGLGLAISSQLVSLMGGRLWVESDLGGGSTFHFTATFAVSQAALAPEPASRESLRGLRVLVVDDNAVNRRILEEILTFWGMEVTLAAGGREALALLEQARDAGAAFSLVLIDALMPDMDGLSVARRIKIDPGLKAAVLLMLTSSDRHGFAESARTAGVTACLNKPIHQNRLMDAILAAVSQAPQIEALIGPPGAPAKAPTRGLRILMAEDNPFNQRVAVLVLAKSGHTVTVAANGREAVEALEGRPFDLVLMDLQMPVMDGLQATVAIRSAEVGTSRHVPIIALTAHAMREDKDRCLAAGMDGYVSKPIQEGKLLRAIEECLDPPRQAPAVGAEAERENRAEPPPFPWDAAAALERLDGDRAFLVEMTAMFLADAPDLMAQIRDALHAGDAASLVAPAHCLKNWAGNFVAAATFAALARLEALGRSGSLAEARDAYRDLQDAFEPLTRALARFDPDSDPDPDPDPDAPEGAGALLAIGKGHRSPPCTP